MVVCQSTHFPATVWWVYAGFAGSDKKVEYLKSLGFDAAFNYKTLESLDATIKQSCPNGVDLFFDNVSLEFPQTSCYDELHMYM